MGIAVEVGVGLGKDRSHSSAAAHAGRLTSLHRAALVQRARQAAAIASPRAHRPVVHRLCRRPTARAAHPAAARQQRGWYEARPAAPAARRRQRQRARPRGGEPNDFREPVFPIPPTLSASPILIVHTHYASSDGVASRMRKLTMTDVDIATTAEEALAAVRRREYRFVLVSRRLEGDPDRGLSLSLQLRRVRSTGRPIVVLTRRLAARDSDEVLMAHGVAGVLLEPIRSASMLAVLASLDNYENQLPLEVRLPAPEPGWSGASSRPIVRADKHQNSVDSEIITDSLRVLLAEDNQVNQRLAVCLHKMGHRVDGQQARALDAIACAIQMC